MCVRVCISLHISNALYLLHLIFMQTFTFPSKKKNKSLNLPNLINVFFFISQLTVSFHLTYTIKPNQYENHLHRLNLLLTPAATAAPAAAAAALAPRTPRTTARPLSSYRPNLRCKPRSRRLNYLLDVTWPTRVICSYHVPVPWTAYPAIANSNEWS